MTVNYHGFISDSDKLDLISILCKGSIEIELTLGSHAEHISSTTTTWLVSTYLRDDRRFYSLPHLNGRAIGTVQVPKKKVFFQSGHLRLRKGYDYKFEVVERVDAITETPIESIRRVVPFSAYAPTNRAYLRHLVTYGAAVDLEHLRGGIPAWEIGIIYRHHGSATYIGSIPQWMTPFLWRAGPGRLVRPNMVLGTAASKPSHERIAIELYDDLKENPDFERARPITNEVTHVGFGTSHRKLLV